MSKESIDGWGFPALSRKAHYFIGGRSLCGKWMFLGAPQKHQETRPVRGPDDCADCHKRACKKLGIEEESRR